MPIRKKQSVSEDVFTLAVDRVRHIFDLFDHVAVSFSGGKDSTVVLNVALQVARERNRLPLRVFHFDEEAIPIEVEEYVQRLSQTQEIAVEHYCIPLDCRNACDPEEPHWYCWELAKKDLWCRPMPAEAITQIAGYDNNVPRSIPEIAALLFPPELGRCCMLLGIRADESITRYRAVAQRTDDNYIVQHAGGFAGTSVLKYKHLFKAYPIYDWNIDDVWTAPALFQWDYCKYYDLLEMTKISRSKQRLAPPFGEEPFQRLGDFAKTNPELWTKMVNRVSGANTAALYSKTALYGFGDVPQKPQNTGWKEFLEQQIQTHDKAIQSQIKKRINAEIRTHFNKTADPILETAHPLTGLSWHFLLVIAVRSDTKGRKAASVEGEKARGANVRKKYNAALRAIETGQ